MASLLMVLCLGYGGGAMADDDEKAVPYPRINACLRAATAARPGNVHKVEIERDNSRLVCKVEIYRGRREYEVKVNLANLRVIKVDND